jgi:hypothetical protein
MYWEIFREIDSLNADKRTAKRVSNGYTTKATLQVEAKPSLFLRKVERPKYL